MAYTEQKTALENISQEVSASRILTNENWHGADVEIVLQRPPRQEQSFYPEPRYIVTEYAPQLSWLFVQIAHVLFTLPEYDGTSKVEMFGRLANTANRYLSKNAEKENQRDLLLAVLHEAFSILEDIEDGTFEYLTLALGNQILDDNIEWAERRGFLNVEETKQFFTEKGITL